MIRYYITLLAIIPIFLFACGDSEKDPTPVTVFDITFEPTQLTFTSDVGEKEIIIKSNRYYTISSNQSWCTITPTVGYADETTTILLGFKRSIILMMLIFNVVPRTMLSSIITRLSVGFITP